MLGFWGFRFGGWGSGFQDSGFGDLGFRDSGNSWGNAGVRTWGTFVRTFELIFPQKSQIPSPKTYTLSSALSP